MFRYIVFTAVLIFGASEAAPPASGSSAGTMAIESQLHQVRAQLQAQHAHTAQLKSRVSELEQRSSAQQAQQAQRDREIAELQRKLASSNPRTTPAPARSSGHL